MSLSWIDLTCLVITLVLFVGIFLLRRRRVNFAVLTVLALVVGAGLGVAFRGHTAYIDPLGTIYIQVITAAVAPLIIISILSSVTSVGSLAKLRSIGAGSVFWLLLSNFLAILLTLGLALAFGIGKHTTLSIEGVDGAALSNLLVPLDKVITGLFPSNVVGDIQSNNIIAIVLFALLIAVSYLLVAKNSPATVAPFKAFIDACKAILFKAVGFIIELTPYAVLALVATSAATAVTRLETVWSLIGVLFLSIAACLLHTYGINSVLLRVWANVRPLPFFQKLTPAQSMAFTTQSSVGTLPLTISALRNKIGVPDEIAGFTAPLGTTIGMPGCAGIWPVLVAVFSVHVLGINYTFTDYAVLVALGLVVSLGTAGVPGTAIMTATAVLTAVGLPVEIMVLLIPISAVAGTFSTMTNVTTAAVSATIVARRQNVLDDDVYEGRKVVDDSPAGGSADEAADLPAPELKIPAFANAGGPTALGQQYAVPVGQCEI